MDWAGWRWVGGETAANSLRRWWGGGAGAHGRDGWHAYMHVEGEGGGSGWVVVTAAAAATAAWLRAPAARRVVPGVGGRGRKPLRVMLLLLVGEGVVMVGVVATGKGRRRGGRLRERRTGSRRHAVVRVVVGVGVGVVPL